MTDVLSIFIELCSIPSPSGNESEVGSYIVKSLDGLVDETSVDAAGNIYAKKRGTGKGTPLLLCAHMDTVEPAGRQEPVIEDGIVKSNGSYVLGADDKAAVAAILDVLAKLKTQKQPHTDVEVLITVREETDSGMKEFPRQNIQSKVALLADISRPIGSIITAAPYVCGYSVEVEAPGCHVALMMDKTPHPLNFLKEFMRIVPFGRISENTVINIAKVRMGESYNSVPQRLHFTGEIRTFETDYYHTFTDLLKRAVNDIDGKVGTRSTLTMYPYCVGYMLKDEETRWVAEVMSIVGVTARPITAFSVGDFNILREWGITPINIGTGALEVHTTRERISIEALTQLRDIFHESILHYSRD